jgi:BirA family transcriptional regulator, biotin operon repressor / biotin---[acetyl-CoA-carboxylase] ligase
LIVKTIFIGKYFKELDSVDSTNSFSVDLIKKNEAKDGMIVFTNKQILGKGQRNRCWVSEPYKNLTFSLIVKTDFLKISNQFYLSMAISIALLEYTNKRLEGLKLSAKIKWPNDILINERKVAGILIENTVIGNQLDWSVIGIGYNLNQEEFDLNEATDFKPISLKNLLSIENNVASELQELSLFIEKWLIKLRKSEYSNIKQNYISNLWNFGKSIEFALPNGNFKIGKIIEIDDFGNLLIEYNGVETIKLSNLDKVSYIN